MELIIDFSYRIPLNSCPKVNQFSQKPNLSLDFLLGVTLEQCFCAYSSLFPSICSV